MQEVLIPSKSGTFRNATRCETKEMACLNPFKVRDVPELIEFHGGTPFRGLNPFKVRDVPELNSDVQTARAKRLNPFKVRDVPEL